MARSGPCISAIFASTSASASASLARFASAFCSLARSFIAERSSSLKTLAPLVGFCVSAMAFLP